MSEGSLWWENLNERIDVSNIFDYGSRIEWEFDVGPVSVRFVKKQSSFGLLLGNGSLLAVFECRFWQ